MNLLTTSGMSVTFGGLRAVNKRCLAGTVGPDEPDEFAFFNSDIDVVDSPQTTKCHRHARCC